MPRHAKLTKSSRDRSMIRGLRKHRQDLETSAGRAFGGLDALIARFQEHLDAMDRVDETEAQWKAALRREEAIENAIKALLQRVKLLLQGHYGHASTTLTDFGVKPEKRRKPKVSTMAVAVAKRKATRKQRRTMGKRQRQKIKGY